MKSFLITLKGERCSLSIGARAKKIIITWPHVWPLYGSIEEVSGQFNVSSSL